MSWCRGSSARAGRGASTTGRNAPKFQLPGRSRSDPHPFVTSWSLLRGVASALSATSTPGRCRGRRARPFVMRGVAARHGLLAESAGAVLARPSLWTVPALMDSRANVAEIARIAACGCPQRLGAPRPSPPCRLFARRSTLPTGSTATFLGWFRNRSRTRAMDDARSR